jgi:hypothetical protein
MQAPVQATFRNPNPGYQGGKIVYVRDLVKEKVTVNGSEVEATRGAHLCQQASVCRTSQITTGPNGVKFAFADAQLNPGEYVRIKGFGDMAPVVAKLYDGHVYSFVGRQQYAKGTDGRTYRNFIVESLADLGPKAQAAPAKPDAPATRITDAEVPFDLN